MAMIPKTLDTLTWKHAKKEMFLISAPRCQTTNVTFEPLIVVVFTMNRNLNITNKGI